MTELPDASLTVENCADEPIHVPGTTQPHGLLLVLEEDTLRVTQVSDNIRVILGVESRQVLGQPLSRLVGAEQQAYVAQEVEQSDFLPKTLF